jgi:hypothetical protein
MALNFSFGKKDQFADGTPAADTTLLDLGSAAWASRSAPSRC